MKYARLLIVACLLTGCTSETTTTVTSTSETSVDPATNEPGSTTEPETTTDEAEPPAADTATATDEDAGEDSDVIVIDVRSEDEWNSGHVERAVHIPHTEIADRISEVTDDKSAKIVLYCAVGGRAGVPKTKLEELGFTNVENAGGFDDVKGRFE